MVDFEKFELENGLRVIVHKDESTPIVAMNILYDVGSRDEDPERTGFAHLFEHLMFGGSANIPSYDAPLQRVGGQNNAYTTSDLTNYYLTIPLNNLETGFWLESDRMLQLAFTPNSLEVQRQVVVEEFKQRYLNQPYGDMWLLLRPLAYKEHPYQWATIGKEIRHIEEATLDDVKQFFATHYTPQNAIMVIAGNVEVEEVKRLAEKWFGPIPGGDKRPRKLPVEPKQTAMRRQVVKRRVPSDGLYMAFHMAERKSRDYLLADLISDVLSRGASSRFNEYLIKEKALFTEVSAYISGEMDPGLFIVAGKLVNGVSMEEAEAAVRQQLDELCQNPLEQREQTKVLNKMESTKRFSDMGVLQKAMGLAYYELLGDASRFNTEVDDYLTITPEELMDFAKRTFRDENCSVLEYHAEGA